MIIIINRYYYKMNIAVNFSEFDREPSGKVNLIGRIKYVHILDFFFFCGILILVGFTAGVILMWASEIILNFLSKSLPMDILGEKNN